VKGIVCVFHDHQGSAQGIHVSDLVHVFRRSRGKQGVNREKYGVNRGGAQGYQRDVSAGIFRTEQKGWARL